MNTSCLQCTTNMKPPNVGAGACGTSGQREETQNSLHETMHLAEARLAQHAPGKCPFWKHRAPKMPLVEAQCAHQKHCHPETPFGSHPTSWVFQQQQHEVFDWKFTLACAHELPQNLVRQIFRNTFFWPQVSAIAGL